MRRQGCLRTNSTRQDTHMVLPQTKCIFMITQPFFQLWHGLMGWNRPRLENVCFPNTGLQTCGRTQFFVFVPPAGHGRHAGGMGPFKDLVLALEGVLTQDTSNRKLPQLSQINTTLLHQLSVRQLLFLHKLQVPFLFNPQ